MRKETTNKKNTLFSLQSASPVLFEIGQQAVDLYYVERISGGLGRRMFLFQLAGPSLICSFPESDAYDIMVSAPASFQINAWDEEDIYSKENIDDNAALIDNGINNITYLFRQHPQSSNALSFLGNVVAVEAGSIYSGESADAIKWIDNLPGGTRLLDKFDLNAFSITLAPLFDHIWYYFSNAGEVTVTDTRQLITEGRLLGQLIKLNKLLGSDFHSLYVDSSARKLRQVWTSNTFRKNSVDDALGELAKVVSKSHQADNLKTAKHIDVIAGKEQPYDKILLQTCQLVGKYEKITFRGGFKNANKRTDALTQILRASNIRVRKVFLTDNWWKNNHGALLGYLKSDNSPVALIPKRSSAYWLINLNTQQKTKVDAAVAEELLPECYSFFSPFAPGVLNAKGLLKFALQFTKQDVILFLVIGVLGALLALAVPIISGYVFNKVIPEGNTRELTELGLILLSTVIVIGLMNFTKSLAILRFEGKSSYKLQSALWDRILSLRVPFFSHYNPGDLAERSLGIEKIRSTLSANVMGAISSGIFSVFYLALLFFYDVRLALLALVMGFIVAAFTLTISLMAYKHVVFTRRMEAMISGFMMMVIRGVSKIRLTGSKEKVFGIWADRFAQQKEHYAKKQSLIIVASIFSFAFPIFASILIYIRIYHLLTYQYSNFEIGDFIAFNSAYLSFQGALINTFMVTVPLMSIKPTYELFKPILEAETEDYDNKQDCGELQGGIEVTNLNFKYADSENWILSDINMKINPGEFIALAGSSGSGKSTLFRILLGFEQYQEGSVLFDHHELKELDIRTVRDQLGVVLQNGKIMQGSVLYNIIGTANYTEEDAWEAARMAGCDKDIENLPLQMHTILPPGGGTLSGGQQQRVIIARALVRKPKILMFDEATSALDNETQQTVSDNLDKMDATRIVIAHRLSTIMHADRIFVMDKGKIVEVGTFEELTNKDGFFQNLVKSQLA